MAASLLSYLIFIPTVVISCYPMKNSFRYHPRRIIMNLGISSLILILTAAFARFRFGFDTNLVLLIGLAVFYFAYHRNLTVPVCKSLSVFLWCAALIGIISNISCGFDAIRNPTLGIESDTLDYAVFQLALGIAAAFILFHPVTKYGSVLIDHLNLTKIWYMTMPFSVIILAANYLLRPRHYVTLYTNNVFLAFWSILSATLLIWCLLSVFFYFIVTGILNAAKTEERNRFLEMQESQFLSQQKYLEESARVRHDFKQVIHTLQELVQNENYEERRAYLDKFAKSLPENEFIHYCGNTALNALLNYYKNYADRWHIRLDLKIDLPDQMPVSDVDLCGIIGNILENASSACLKLPPGQRWIQLTALTKNKAQLFIIATNSFNGKVKQKDGRYFSTSRNGTGLGLASIRTTAENYNGTAEFSHQDGEFYTDVVVPL